MFNCVKHTQAQIFTDKGGIVPWATSFFSIYFVLKSIGILSWNLYVVHNLQLFMILWRNYEEADIKYNLGYGNSMQLFQ